MLGKDKVLLRIEGSFLTSDNCEIKVKIQDNLVSFSVIDSNKVQIVNSFKKNRSIQRWYLYWDNKILWVHSCDIGSSYWDLNESNIKEEVLIYNNHVSIDIPKGIKEDIIK